MSAASRRKGLTGEREIARALEAAGWTVRGLEAGGDLLAFKNGKTLALESKRYAARARIPEWWRQAFGDAPRGVPAVLVPRADHDQAMAYLTFADLLELIG